MVEAGAASREAAGTLLIHPARVEALLRLPPAAYARVNFDPSAACNLACPYCQASRKPHYITLEQAELLFSRIVLSLEFLSFGCTAEPTTHPEVERMLALVGEHARPGRVFKFQTNGMALDRIDPQLMRAAGVTRLSVSIDSLNPATFAELRRGAELGRVRANIERVREAHSAVEVVFVAVVCSANIDEIEELIRHAAADGISAIELREVVWRRDPTSEQLALALKPGQYDRLQERLQVYQDLIPLHFCRGESQLERERGLRLEAEARLKLTAVEADEGS